MADRVFRRGNSITIGSAPRSYRNRKCLFWLVRLFRMNPSRKRKSKCPPPFPGLSSPQSSPPALMRAEPPRASALLDPAAFQVPWIESLPAPSPLATVPSSPIKGLSLGFLSDSGAGHRRVILNRQLSLVQIQRTHSLAVTWRRGEGSRKCPLTGGGWGKPNVPLRSAETGRQFSCWVGEDTQKDLVGVVDLPKDSFLG